MRPSPLPTTRPAFTLLEMILAASITVLLLAALYVAVDVQLTHAADAREVIEQTTLARTLVNRMANDIVPSTNEFDPSRFQSASSGSGTSGSGTSGSGTSGSGTTGATGSTNTSSTGTTGTGTTGSATGGTSSTASSTTANPPPILLLQGTTDTLTVWMSKVPYSPNSSNNPNDPNSLSNPNAPPGFADTRRVDYWLAGGGSLGLARQEQTNLTDDDVLPGTSPPDVGDPGSKLIVAPEVKSLQFQYFDGAAWQESWDGTQLGSDNVTPLGPPAAVKITIGLAPAGGGELKTYSHVVAIPTANGSTSAQISSSDGVTTTVTTANSSNGGSASTAGGSSDSSTSGQ
jgi:hypothetical protein